ncbi:MAG: LysR family transcriptional regulator [Rhodoferax sp.]|uniref:LysR family transcriptional regulator n=1 Tax=Rhodoferax sp. TaxID=50421 RepID=UPI003265A489
MDTLLSMRVFRRVAEAGSFVAAADQLQLSSAMASRHVAHLERYLGARLLHRSTRHLSLTDGGNDYLERCKNLLDELDEAESQVGQLALTPRGQLRVSAPVSFGTRHLGAVVGTYAARYPDVRLNLQLSDQMVELAESGFDMALRIGVQPTPNLIARRLCAVRVMLVCSPGYARRYGLPRTPEDLQKHRAIGYAYSEVGDAWTLCGPDGPRNYPIRPVLYSNNGDLALAAAAADVGISSEPTFLVGEGLRNGSLISVLPDYPQEELSLYVVYLNRRYLSAKLRTFIDLLAEHFSTPYWDAGV